MDDSQIEEKRDSLSLSNHQIEAIAVRAADLVMDRMYVEIGKSVVKKFFLIVGILTVGLTAYLAGKGYIFK